jgi:excisionase family DNA binding protein
VPGFLTVRGAAEQLKLAPRSVRDLIYAGRLPSVRLGRVHFVSVGDVELERRRRLGLPLPRPRARTRRPRPPAVAAGAAEPRATKPRKPAEQTTRRQRAAERAALLERWLHASHHASAPRLPFTAETSTEPGACDACQRPLRPGARRLHVDAHDAQASATLCLTCGRRAVLRWADDRRRESIAARRLATDVTAVEPASAVAAAASTAQPSAA